MNKKLLSIIMIATLIMFVGINVKAGCQNKRDQSSQLVCPNTTCSTANETACKSDALNACCNWVDPTCTSISGTDGCTSLMSTDSRCSVTGISFSPSGCSQPSGDLSCTATENTGTCSCEGSTCTFVASYTGTKTECKKTVTLTISKGSSLSTTADAEVTVKWSDGPTRTQCTTRTDFGREAAEAAQAGYYYSGCKVDSSCWNPEGETDNQKCDVYTRGCGNSNQPPEPQPHCYKDKNGFLYYEKLEKLNADKTKIDTSEVTKKGYVIAVDKNGKEIPREDCYTKFACTETPLKMAEKRVETPCNEIHDPKGEPSNENDKELTGVYIKMCGIKYGSSIGSVDGDGNDKELFYKITCTETMRTAFNGPEFDDGSSFMYPGTGFGFHYLMKTKVACEGYFNEAYYNAAATYLGKRGSVEDEAGSLFAADAKVRLAGLNKIKNSYANWTVNYKVSNITGTIKDNQPNGKVERKDEHQFNLVLEELPIDGDSTCGELPTGPDGKLNTKFNYQELHDIKMKLPTLWYDKTASYVSETENQYIVKECKTDEDNCLGRIFPISDSKEFAGSDYTYTVTINNLGMRGKWTNLETCDITMKEKNLYFRSINLNDPFIKGLSNSNHEIGQNWKNSRFDFTQIIDPNLWSKDSQYNMVRITEEDGQNIKNELSANKAYYTGICSSGSASVASTICGKYKQAVNGKL